MSDEIKVGLIGADTSHAIAFAQAFNDVNNPHRVPGVRLIAAFPGGSTDWELSYSRVQGYTVQLRDEFGVEICDTIEQVVQAADAIIINSGDGRVHLEQFRLAAPYGKPVYINKPLAVSAADAIAIRDLAREHRVPVMSCSALRYAAALTEALGRTDEAASSPQNSGEANGSAAPAIIGADCFGPGYLEPTQPGFYWYGIHTIEMLYTILGGGCKQVTAMTGGDCDAVTGVWADGRIGTVRCDRKGSGDYGVLLHDAQGIRFVNATAHDTPIMASLAENIVRMFRTGKPPIDFDETVELIRFAEAANESLITGATVLLEG